MKKKLLIMIAFMISVGSLYTKVSAAEATPTESTVLVNGVNVGFDAYLIEGNNYFKLRDLAYTLSNTDKKFEVGYNVLDNAITITSGKSYTSNGSEMADKSNGPKDATLSKSKVIKDDKEVNITAYNIDGNNYFKLRDLGEALNFSVDWDSSKNAIVIDTNNGYSNVETNTKEETVKPLEIKDFGWTQTTVPYYGDNIIYYALKIKNPNENLACKYPSFTITAKSKDGKILTSDKHTFASISANDTIVYGWYMRYEGDVTSTVNVDINFEEKTFKKQTTDYINSSNFVISNVSENIGNYNITYTGEIVNNSSVDCSDISISIIYKLNNKIIAGTTGYIDGLGAGEKTYFDIEGIDDIEYDSYELYAYQS